ncbi:MAG: ABC transporter permease [Micromonosporaceae bacterium]
MSAADATLGLTTRRVPLRLGGRFLRSELMLVFGRRRNLAGMLVLAGVPVLIAVAVRLSGSDSRRGGPDFFSSITDNGFFVALAALSVELPLFLPIAVAAISADSIAGEANLGTLRYLLPVPVHRSRLLAVKYLSVVAFAFVATVWVATVGLVAGLALFGGGPVTLLSGSQIGLGEGLLRLLAICAYLAACLSALGALGLFVSTLTEQPIGATIAIVCASVASFIVDSIPQVSWVHPYLLTHWWLSFGDLLRDPVATDGIRHGLLSAGAYTLIFTTAAWARFTNRDVTS